MTAESPRHQPRRPTTGLTRTALPSAVVLALAVGLAGCKGVVVASSGAGGSQTVAAASTSAASGVAPAASVASTDPTSTPASTSATASPSQAQASGSVSVSVSSPVTVPGTVLVPVSCVVGLAYHATVATAVVHGDRLSFSVAVPRYSGPGSYPASSPLLSLGVGDADHGGGRARGPRSDHEHGRFLLCKRDRQRRADSQGFAELGVRDMTGSFCAGISAILGGPP